MIKSIRALAALVSFALGSALFGGEVTTYVGSGQQIAISIAGTTGADIWVVDLSTNQTVVFIQAGPYNWGQWNTDYFYNGGPVQSGPISLVVNSPSSASILGLPAGNYKIIAGNLIDYASSQSGNTYYLSQRNAYYTEWLDFTFDIY